MTIDCQGHLASIPNEETHLFLKGLGQSLGAKIWVGGYWNENGWHWSDGTPWQYQSWLPGEPNREDQKCIQMFLHNDHRWDDEECWRFQNFFCETGDEIYGKQYLIDFYCSRFKLS